MNLKKMDFSKATGFVKKYKYVIVVLVVGIFLVGFPSGKETDQKSVSSDTMEFDVGEFEKRVEKVLSECEGVGKVNVILSIESGPEKVYAKEEKQSEKKDNETTKESDRDIKPSIISEGSGYEVPVLVKERYPKFRGAAIACTGAESLEVQKSIIEVVSALTGLSSDRISVVKMK
ncbi:MAG: hypothetical protein IJO61_09080 [Oscillospiraceae bacterium]|nr:hypothetical protein [Oscillospiraceae bacterium]MBQ6847269.1 hypothetical protein [Oscillospiraceae bacterium]MBQ7120032.1 hypothetical protein [Oscillospiraceae bacterium]